MKRALLVVIGVGFVGGGSCGPPPAPTLSQLKTELFEPRCGNAAGCHADNPVRGLDLTIDPHGALVDVATTTDPTKKYVVPGDPANSLLLTILRGPVGGDDELNTRQMPPGFALPEETIAEVEAWIAAGALDD